MPDKATMFRGFEAQGIDAVRAKIDQGGYNSQWKSAAIEWIGKKGKEAQRRAETTRTEQAAIARSATRATWIGAIAAIVAAIVSVAGAAISLVASHH